MADSEDTLPPMDEQATKIPLKKGNLGRANSDVSGNLKSRQQKVRANYDKNHGKEEAKETFPADADEIARKRIIYEAAFREIDKDQSGQIDLKELATLFQNLGWDSSEGCLKEARDALDTDKNGEIGLEEFWNWASYTWDSRVLKGRGSVGYTPESQLSAVGEITENIDLENGTQHKRKVAGL